MSVFDKSREFYQQSLVFRAYPSTESFICGDWLDTLSEHPDEFDVALSDLTSGNLPVESRPHFYQSLAAAMRFDGLFFDKVLTHRRGYLPLLKTLQEFASAPLNLLEANRFNCRLVFGSELIGEIGSVDTAVIYARLREAAWTLNQAGLVRLCERITPSGFRWFYGQPWELASRPFLNNFEVVVSLDEPEESPYGGLVDHFIARPAANA